MRKQWKQWETFIFLGSKITADGDCSHEIKRRLLLGRKVMTKLDSILKSRVIILTTKVRLVKAMVFPVVMCGCESCTIKKAEHWRTDAFEMSWRGLWSVPWTAKSSNQSILKEISPEYSLEQVMLIWSSNTLVTWCKEPTHWRRPWFGETLRAGCGGATEDEMVRQHHRLNGHEFEQTPVDSGGQRSLACCSPWGCKKLVTT